MDMLFCQHIIIDWEKLKLMRQEQAINNNNKENKKQVEQDYHISDLVQIVTPTSECCKQRKLSSPTKISHAITRVYANGTVWLLQGTFKETMSIQWLCPYKPANNKDGSYV